MPRLVEAKAEKNKRSPNKIVDLPRLFGPVSTVSPRRAISVSRSKARYRLTRKRVAFIGSTPPKYRLGRLYRFLVLSLWSHPASIQSLQTPYDGAEQTRGIAHGSDILPPSLSRGGLPLTTCVLNHNCFAGLGLIWRARADLCDQKVARALR